MQNGNLLYSQSVDFLWLRRPRATQSDDSVEEDCPYTGKEEEKAKEAETEHIKDRIERRELKSKNIAINC